MLCIIKVPLKIPIASTPCLLLPFAGEVVIIMLALDMIIVCKCLYCWK